MNPFIKVTWQDVPENFTAEKIRRVKTYFEQKYNSKNVKIITKTLTNVQNTRLESLEVTDNILDNQYQKNLMKDFIKDNAIDVKWELVDRIGNVYNRLVLYRGDHFHISLDYFGQDLYDGRLFQTFFFNTER